MRPADDSNLDAVRRSLARIVPDMAKLIHLYVHQRSIRLRSVFVFSINMLSVQMRRHAAVAGAR